MIKKNEMERQEQLLYLGFWMQFVNTIISSIPIIIDIFQNITPTVTINIYYL